MNLLTGLGLTSLLFCVWFTWHQAFCREQDSSCGQTPRASLVEAWANIVIGFSINFAINLGLIPLMTGTELSLSANLWGGWVYTAISMARQFAIRRWFNERIHLFSVRAAERLA